MVTPVFSTPGAGTVRLAALQALMAVVLAAGCVTAAQAQARAAPRGMGAVSAPAVDAAGQPIKVESRPFWTELSPGQHKALAPLAPHWGGLSETHKRKWIAMSRNFDGLPAAEQAKLQDRMIDWTRLSAQERAQARLNYAETRRLAPDDKKARWEAYQALSDEERSKLAAAVPARPAGAATAVKPTPQRLARVPGPQMDTTHSRIGVSAAEVDHNTLLPQHPMASPGMVEPATYR